MYQRYLCLRTEVYHHGLLTKIRVTWHPQTAHWRHRDAVAYHSPSVQRSPKVMK